MLCLAFCYCSLHCIRFLHHMPATCITVVVALFIAFCIPLFHCMLLLERFTALLIVFVIAFFIAFCIALPIAFFDWIMLLHSLLQALSHSLNTSHTVQKNCMLFIRIDHNITLFDQDRYCRFGGNVNMCQKTLRVSSKTVTK